MLHPAIKRMFWVKKHPLIFGMIHVPALPGTPKSSLQMGKIAEKVIEETEIYAKCQIDGIILENMHDLPYQLHTNHGPEICASMTRLCLECSNALGRERREFLLGVQILAAANKEALSVAMAADFDFIRAEAYVFSHVADEGWMDGCAGNLLRYRRSIGAEGVAVVADVKKKHRQFTNTTKQLKHFLNFIAHAITADISVAETAKASEFFLADGIVLTGNATGHEACPTELKEARSSCSLPIFMGSGITTENVHKFSNADAFIVGSYFKKDGKWNNEIDEGRVKKLVEEVSKMRRSHIIPGDS